MKVLILYAMKQEGQQFVLDLNLREHQGLQGLPVSRFFGKFQGKEVMVSFNGTDFLHGVDAVGTVAAALNAYGNCLDWSPDWVINAGTAGGFSHQSEIAEVFLNEAYFYFHDRQIEIELFERYAEGIIPAVDNQQLAQKLNIRRATISTGNSLNLKNTEKIMLSRHKRVAKEMEAAAIAQVCAQFKIPFLALKSITDFIDIKEQSSAQFFTNLQMAQKSLNHKLQQLIQEL